MSGHSKWSKIKHQKGTADIKRSQSFTKIANTITIAVRQGGEITDPEANFKLRLAIEKAHEINMPKDNILRAIKRGKGKTVAGGPEEVTYEGYGVQGVAFLIEAATDNRQRTTAAIKNIFDNHGGNLASPGSVIYNFKTLGKIELKKENLSEEEILEKVITAGGSDLEIKIDKLIVFGQAEKINQVKDNLIKSGFTVLTAEIFREPQNLITLTDLGVINRVKEIINRLEELDDVLKVYTNFTTI